jgi:hypothetical protein
MRPDERLGLARLSYVRAVAAAREQTTRASWMRLLTASRNLKSATQDREKGGTRSAGMSAGGVVDPSARAGRTAGQTSITALQQRSHGAEDARLELTRDWEHSRALRARARALVAQALALREQIAVLARAWPYPLHANL